MFKKAAPNNGEQPYGWEYHRLCERQARVLSETNAVLL